MEPSEKELLDKTYRLARDNNRMLKAIRRNAFLGSLLRIVLWVAVVGISLWFYMNFLHPVLTNMTEVFGQMQGAGSGFFEQWNEFMETFQANGSE